MTNPWVFPVPCRLPADPFTLRYERISATAVFHCTSTHLTKTFNFPLKINKLKTKTTKHLQINT
ncbi:hypothetical protein [Vibrio metoecus]|uniref:Uncharacterized protein n=1 Tax=Vibrio metoecus TaxID=1481663 RepID=A0A271VP58_VIBMT|nr:hypothetical protein [Vibrio metoecus]PAR19948.1 hypothetical protein CGU03_14255 [Vibrio metoecus]PAR23401.1 hypothetical protein CGU02_14965 [Vibrio metoecus]PAR34289.1 hypothetical protein CGT97_16695 [Vibrio metoecus]PAR42795.1 hypothetical protein CGT96_10395 [Vibrio metoecus]